MKYLFYFSMLSIFLFPSFGEAAPIDISNSFTPVTKHIEYWVEENGPVDFDQAKKQAFVPVELGKKVDSLSFGFGSKPVWVTLSVQAGKDGVWVLDQSHWHIHQMDLYLVKKEQTQHFNTGSLRPFSKRLHPSLGLSIPLDFKAGIPQTLYVRFETWQMLEINLNFWDDHSFHYEEQRLVGLFSWILGVLGILLLIALYMSFVLKEKVYYLYAAYVMAMAGVIAANNGTGALFLWPDFPLFGAISTPFFALFSFYWMVSFFIAFLDLKQMHPLSFYLLRGMQVAVILVGLFSLVIGYGKTMALLILISLSGQVYLIAVTIYGTRKGNRRAKLLLYSWLPMVVGLVFHAGRLIFPWLYQLPTFILFQIATVFQAIIFAFTLASQILELKQDLVRQSEEHIGHLDAKVQARTSELFSANKSLNKLIQDKNNLLGIVAHDLKNPVGNILNLQELIGLKLKEGDEKEALELNSLIQISASNMMGLINEILDFSVLEMVQEEDNQQQVDFLQLVLAEVESFDPMTKKKNLVVDTTGLSKTLNQMVPNLTMKHIVGNLISNAIKYSPLGGAISLGLDPSGQSFWVQDQGAGIPLEEQKNLFKKYSRTSVTPTAGESATGLGLFIAKQLSDSIHCTLGVKSEVGKGSKFWLKFPSEDEQPLKST